MSFIDTTPDFQAGAKDQDTAYPEFRMQPVQNNFESARQARPVFEEKEFVHIFVPGDRKSEWDGHVKPEHRQRWPRHYAAFKASQEMPTEGTPLAEWPAVTRSQVLELAAANVKTVEQLAGLPDDLLSKAVSMGGLGLREKALRFLEFAKGAAPMEALAAENADLKSKMAAMQADHEDLKRRVNEMSAAKAVQTETIL